MATDDGLSILSLAAVEEQETAAELMQSNPMAYSDANAKALEEEQELAFSPAQTMLKAVMETGQEFGLHIRRTTRGTIVRLPSTSGTSKQYSSLIDRLDSIR